MKSFTLGLGLGILFSALIFLVAYNLSDKGSEEQAVTQMSDEDIEKRAKELGMIYFSELPEDTTETVSQEEPVQTAEVQSTIQEETTDLADNEQSDDIQEDEYVKVSVKGGNNANYVCRLLYSNGLVDDAESFKEYLIENGKTTQIKSGTFKIPKGLDYEELSDIITKKPS